MRRLPIVMLLGMLQILPAVADSTQTRSYIGGVVEIAAYAYCDGSAPNGLPAPSGQGFVCFHVPEGRTLDVTVTDAVFSMFVPAGYAFYKDPENLISYGGFCDAVTGVEVPADATLLYVFLPESPLGIYPSCPLFGTTGTVTATFS